MLEQNIKLVRKRWPDIAEVCEVAQFSGQVGLINDTPQQTLSFAGIHLTSAYDRQSEATVQTQLIPMQSKHVWVYGFALGDIQRLLLQRSVIERINVVIMNPAIALISMAQFDHADWLSDARIELHLGTNDKLAAPLVANPACLQLAHQDYINLRDRVMLELATPYINKKHSADNPKRQERILANEKYIKSDGDVSDLFSTQQDKVVMVVGAGPSLTAKLASIRENRNDLYIIAVNSALKPLIKDGIIPDVVVVIDPDEKILSCFEGFSHEYLDKTVLVYLPNIPVAVTQCWRGPRLTAYTTHQSYNEMQQKYPKGTLHSVGSVLHTAIDLAVQTGSRKIVLVGADLAFPHGQKYADNAGWDDDAINSMSCWVLNGYSQQVETTPALRGYLRDLETYIKNNPNVAFFNTSRDGAFIQGTKWLEEISV